MHITMMKRVCFVCCLLLTVFTSSAQVKSSPTKGSGAILPPAISNVQQTASSIAGELTGRLGLNPSKTPQLIALLQRYLQQKSLINPLATSNKDEYQAKFKALQTALFDQLRGVMGPDKFALFQKLQSSAKNTNAAHLFY
jgi:hypothetical protein